MDAITAGLSGAMAGAGTLLAEVGETRVKWVEVFRDRLVVHPERMSEGADIAARLGIMACTDYPSTRPGFTVWSGRWRDLDLFVYAELRGASRAVRAWPA